MPQKRKVEAKNLTGKKLELHLKREAAKAQKHEEKEKKKEEAERRRAAVATTKKTLQLATKITGPMTNAWTAGADVLSKAAAVESELPDGSDLAKLKETVGMIDAWRKDCSNALNTYTKNPKCDLKALDFNLETANETIKDCQSATKAVRKMVTDLKKLKAPVKAKGGA